MLSKEQIDRLESVCSEAINRPFDNFNYEDFNNTFTPETVSELIAMLRESQKDAARYHKWRKETAKDHGYREDYIDQTLDAAMQRDCDGAQHNNQELNT